MIFQLEKKIHNTSKKGDILIAAPESIKSFFLKFAEQMHALESFDVDALRHAGGKSRENDISTGLLTKMKAKSDMADGQLPVFEHMRAGVLIMDECDVLLHPLRSELNFPIGHKYPIDLSGYRWELPIFLLDAVFAGETGRLTVDFAPSSVLEVSLQRTRDVVRKGLRTHAFMVSGPPFLNASVHVD